MPCFAANFSARPRSLAATATTSTPSTSRAGFTSAAGVMRAAPRVAMRRLVMAAEIRGARPRPSGEAGDQPPPTEDAQHADQVPRGQDGEAHGLDRGDPQLAPVEAVAVDEPAQGGEGMGGRQRECDRLEDAGER